MNSLTGTFFAPSHSILSIEGAQYLINITHLLLYQNQISDISALANLTESIRNIQADIDLIREKRKTVVIELRDLIKEAMDI